MRSPDDPSCEFALGLSHEEFESLTWLLRTLKKLSKNPKSKNQCRAIQVSVVLEKMRDHLHDTHATCHEMEERISELDHELRGHQITDKFMIAVSKMTSTDGLN